MTNNLFFYVSGGHFRKRCECVLDSQFVFKENGQDFGRRRHGLYQDEPYRSESLL